MRNYLNKTTNADTIYDESVNKDDYQAAWQRTLDNLKVNDTSYHFRQSNPYWESVKSQMDNQSMSDDKETVFDDLYATGMQLFNEGHVNEAINAFEAATQVNSDSSEAWYMLGICQTENDNDKSSIICLQKSIECDQYNLSSLLTLGICYVNELDSLHALESLKSWVSHNPMFYGLDINVDEYSDGSLMDNVVQLMEAAVKVAPSDVDVHVVLGVLYSVTNDYKLAEICFKKALELQNSSPDYSLLNKVSSYNEFSMLSVTIKYF